MNKRTDGQTDRRTGGQADTRTGRPTNRHTDKPTNNLKFLIKKNHLDMTFGFREILGQTYKQTLTLTKAKRMNYTNIIQ